MYRSAVCRCLTLVGTSLTALCLTGPAALAADDVAGPSLAPQPMALASGNAQRNLSLVAQDVSGIDVASGAVTWSADGGANWYSAEASTVPSANGTSAVIAAALPVGPVLAVKASVRDSLGNATELQLGGSQPPRLMSLSGSDWTNAKEIVVGAEIPAASGTTEIRYSIGPSAEAAQAQTRLISGDGLYTLPVDEGVSTVWMWLRDEVGNESPAQALSSVVRIDRTAPNLSGAVAERAGVRLLATDSLSGISSGLVVFQGQTARTLNLVAPLVLPAGRQTIQATVVDRAGNSSNMELVVKSDNNVSTAPDNPTGPPKSSNPGASNPKLTVAVAKSLKPKQLQTVKFSGVCVKGNSKVKLQRRQGSRWIQLKTASCSKNSSRYSIKLKQTKRGKLLYRVVQAKQTSGTLILTVRKR